MQIEPQLSRMRNLIITSSFGYHATQLLPFLESAHRACGEAEVAVITTATEAKSYEILMKRYPNLSLFLIPASKTVASSNTTEALARFRQFLWKSRLTTLLLLKSKLGWKPLVREDRLSRLGLSLINAHVCIRRYFAAKTLLAERQKGTVGSVMLADIRDVVFQSNPFSHITAGRFTGDEILKIKECPSNSTWIMDAYGPKTYDKLAENVSICSGVSFGALEAMQEYLAAFCDETIAVMQDKCLDTLPVWDQAFHIKLLLCDNLPFQRVAWNGFLATVAQAESEHLQVNEEGLVEVDGRVPAILHQYDRHPQIREHIYKTYC